VRAHWRFAVNKLKALARFGLFFCQRKKPKDFCAAIQVLQSPKSNYNLGYGHKTIKAVLYPSKGKKRLKSQMARPDTRWHDLAC
jgi:hypothetical protein